MSGFTAEPLSRVTPEPLRWLWEPYLPRGKLALLDGDPGVGKSLLTIDLAARLSRGGPLPDGKPSGRPHTTLFLPAEDNPADTIRPRAEAAGADLDRLVVASGPGGTPFQFPRDLEHLAVLLDQYRPDLVVIDPLMAFLPPAIPVSSDQSVRQVLVQLAGLAAKYDGVILLVRHLRKKGGAKAIYRGLGSIGIVGSARAGLVAGRHPADQGLGVLAGPKANNTGRVPSLGFRIRPAAGGDGHTPVVEWTGPTDLDADGLGAAPVVPVLPRDRATAWLRAELAGGPRPAEAVATAAAAAGIPERTLDRAKAELHVGSRQAARPGDGRVWYWFDPDAPWPADAPFPKPRDLLPPLPPLPELPEL